MKKNMTKVMAMGMVLTMLAGTTVFAVDGTATNDMAAAGSEMDVKEEGFTTDSGKIVSVENPEQTVFPLWKSKTKMAVCALQLMQTA